MHNQYVDGKGIEMGVMVYQFRRAADRTSWGYVLFQWWIDYIISIVSSFSPINSLVWDFRPGKR